ncbi:MAG TPA: tripartite tricarboxylate transporter substrate binding protein [Casimicrobiaceae bacterium]|nr:tripartite tricarboxylate transporter substrate binding protein [Casimicrobiaceae bacterium]
MIRVVHLFTVLLFAAVSTVAHGQPYPSKPIKFVVPFPAGGDLDPIARGLGDHFQATWGQPYVVENKAGANAMIGTEFVAKAPPDGYTLLICSPGAMTINPNLYPKVPYTVGKDIIPVSLVATAPMVLVVSKKLPAKTYPEFVSHIKANPGNVSFASAGRGNVTHLVAELYMREANLSTVHVPYKGAQAVIADLLGGHIEMYFNPLPSARGYVKQNADKVTPLAVTTRVRSPQLPDVPTLDELGLKGFDVYSWYGLCAPGGTPKEIVSKLSAEVARALSSAELPERLRGFGTNPQASTPEQFAEQIRSETAQWAKIIKEKDIKAE